MNEQLVQKSKKKKKLKKKFEKKKSRSIFEKIASRTSQKHSLEPLYQVTSCRPLRLSVSRKLSEKKTDFSDFHSEMTLIIGISPLMKNKEFMIF